MIVDSQRLFGRALGLLRDASVIYSFDASGFAAHRREFDPSDLDVDLSGKVCLVTGANSGIGLETARGLARLGAEVRLLCRRRDAGEQAVEDIRRSTGSQKLHLDSLDVSSMADVRAFAARHTGPVDVLVHNAGVLMGSLQRTAEGIEVTFATHVVGPFLLTQLLLPRLGDAGRVVTVSSGGMYPVKLDVDELERPREFDGLRAYALAKRAQVVLAELFTERCAGRNIRFDVMHPGWADTSAVRSSLPRFHKLMQERLRQPAEGADTVIWLAASKRIPEGSARFWFDRKVQPKHLVPWTRESENERKKLWATCERLSAAR